MFNRRFIMLACITLMGFLFGCKDSTPPPTSREADTMPKVETIPGADMIFAHGKIMTVDHEFSIAEAVAVRDGKILAVGTNEEILKYRGDATKMLNLRGKTMLPGFNDGHIHPVMAGFRREPYSLDLGFDKVSSIADIARRVAERAEALPDGSWITGMGWTRSALNEVKVDPARWPTKEDLDPVSRNNPVAFSDLTGHISWVNSAALKLAGITADTPSPEGGSIMKDPETGEPNGILHEKAADLVRELIPLAPIETRKKVLADYMKELNSLGITSLTDAATTAQDFEVYKKLCEEGKITVRVNALILMGAYGGDPSMDYKESLRATLDRMGDLSDFDETRLRIAGVKIFADGTPFSTDEAACWMYEQYPDGTHGGLVFEGATIDEQLANLQEAIRMVNQAGYQVGIHAIGSRTTDVVVDGIIAALDEKSWDARHYIIHGLYITDKTIPLLAKHDIGYQSQLGFKVIQLRANNVFQDAVHARSTPLRSLIDHGVHCMNSSDAPVVPVQPLQWIETAIVRENSLGVPRGPEWGINLKEAIRIHTIEPAWQDRQDDIKGSIEPGKLADFCILDGDISAVAADDPRNISDLSVQMTILGGKVVYNGD